MGLEYAQRYARLARIIAENYDTNNECKEELLQIPRPSNISGGKMKGVECKFDDLIEKFRYLYNAGIDASLTLRQCPNCQALQAVDEPCSQTGSRFG
ncbi:MAG: hypothetical protein WA096_02495 [Smithella sp.]|jgi:hypothetical protein